MAEPSHQSSGDDERRDAEITAGTEGLAMIGMALASPELLDEWLALSERARFVLGALIDAGMKRPAATAMVVGYIVGELTGASDG